MQRVGMTFDVYLFRNACPQPHSMNGARAVAVRSVWFTPIFTRAAMPAADVVVCLSVVPTRKYAAYAGVPYAQTVLLGPTFAWFRSAMIRVSHSASVRRISPCAGVATPPFVTADNATDATHRKTDAAPVNEAPVFGL